MLLYKGMKNIVRLLLLIVSYVGIYALGFFLTSIAATNGFSSIEIIGGEAFGGITLCVAILLIHFLVEDRTDARARLIKA